VISTTAILVVFLIGAVFAIIGWTTYAYTTLGHGEIERSILGDETYRQEYDD
jgi:ABC-type uncharacterized transport system permease subunit